MLIKLLALVAATAFAITLVVVVTSETAAGAAPEAPAHTFEEVRNVCRLLELSIGGPDPNLVGLARYRPVHLFGLHLAQCCFYDLRYGLPGWVGQYTWGWDEVDWFGDPWCS